ncbi:MAG: ABC transporter permease, partial [Sphaerochaeta sp.]|nr:ABC transporter permease [Sphaerochaeta sp.]
MMKNRKHIKWGFLFFFLPVVLWLFLLIVLPHLELLRLSFTKTNTGKLTLDNYLAFFKEPIYWLTFVRTAGYSILVTFLVMVISLPVSFYISKIVKARMSGTLMVLILVPFWV